jgi:MATE family multidrug resistance protein
LLLFAHTAALGTSPASLPRDSYLTQLAPVHPPVSIDTASSEGDSVASEEIHGSLKRRPSNISLLPSLIGSSDRFEGIEEEEAETSDGPFRDESDDSVSVTAESLTPTTVPTEATPLLPVSPTVSADSVTFALYRRELGIITAYTIPIFGMHYISLFFSGYLFIYFRFFSGTHMLEYSLLVVTVISVGHLGTIELASASLSSMTVNVVSLSIINGFCAALDTLCPQSWTSPNPEMTSLHALRTACILVVFLVPQIAILWLV